MKKAFLIAILCGALLPLMAQAPQHQCNGHSGNQGHNCGHCPHHQQGAAKAKVGANGLAVEINNAFPGAKSVKKQEKWTAVYDAGSKLLGYAVYSKPASDGITGYAGETPLMIALDAKKQVISVQMLQNMESPGYVQLVVNAGLLNSWNGMKANKAATKKVDAVAGATFTSTSVIKSLQAALKKL